MREQGSSPEGLQALRGYRPFRDRTGLPWAATGPGAATHGARTTPAARAHLPAKPSHGKIDEVITHLVSGFGDRTPRMARTQRIKLG